MAKISSTPHGAPRSAPETVAPVARRTLLAGAAGASLAALLTACSSASGQGSDDRTLTWGWELPTTWDSALAIGYDVHVLSLVYSGLTKLSAEGEAEPDLAEEWNYNDAGDAVTFTLREGGTFTDGEPVTAQAVKKSLERGRDLPDATSAQSLVVIKDITADTERELTVHLDEPNYQIPPLLAGLIGHLLSPKQIDSEANIALEPIGAGPFSLTEYVPDSHAVLTRNTDYWNADAFDFDVLKVVPKPESSVAVPGVVSGQYTIAQIENSQIETARNGNLRTDVNTIFNIYTLQVNTRFDPFTDDRVTRALSHAVDRQGLVDSILFGHGTPTWQPFTEGYVGYDPELENLYPHDITTAKKLLADAGHPDGIDVDLYIDNDPLVQQIAEVIQTQVADAGIRLGLEVAPAGGGILQAHDYTLNFSSYSGRESPAQGLEVLYTEGGWMNISERESPHLSDALRAVRSTPVDDPDYADLLQEATHIAVTEQAPHVFLVNWVRAYAVADEVQGFDPYEHTQRFEGVSLG